MGGNQSILQQKVDKSDKNDRNLSSGSDYWDREIAPYLLCYLKELMEASERPENVKLWMHERLKRDLDVQQTVSRRHFVCAVQRAKEQIALHSDIIGELDIKINLLQKEIKETSAFIEELQTVEYGTRTNPYAELQSSLDKFNKERSSFIRSLKFHPLLKIAADKKVARNELNAYLTAHGIDFTNGYAFSIQADDNISQKRTPPPGSQQGASSLNGTLAR